MGESHISETKTLTKRGYSYFGEVFKEIVLTADLTSNRKRSNIVCRIEFTLISGYSATGCECLKAKVRALARATNLEQHFMGSERPYCVVCGRIRFVVAAGLLISVLFVTRTEIDFIKGLDLNEILFRIIFGAFIVICGFKAYQEFWKPNKGKPDDSIE